MRSRSRFLAAPALLLLAVSLASCGGSDEPEADLVVPSASSGPPGLQLRVVTTTATDSGAGAPTLDQQTQLDSFDCATDQATAPAEDPMVACDKSSQTFLLEPAVVDGGVESADASQDAGGSWVIDIVYGPDSSQKLADVTGSLVGTPDELALVFQGVVLASPTIDSRITDGQFQLTGDYTEAEATELAEKIQAGA